MLRRVSSTACSITRSNLHRPPRLFHTLLLFVAQRHVFRRVATPILVVHDGYKFLCFAVGLQLCSMFDFFRNGARAVAGKQPEIEVTPGPVDGYSLSSTGLLPQPHPLRSWLTRRCYPHRVPPELSSANPGPSPVQRRAADLCRGGAAAGTSHLSDPARPPGPLS